MKALKIYVLVSMIFSLGYSWVYAVNDKYDSWYKVIQESALNFKAYVENGKVQTSWNAFSKSWDYGFTYYKIVRSFDNSNLSYPQDGHIGYISDIKKTSYTDYDSYNWWAYYRVCVVAQKKWDYSFCSNIVYVKKNDDVNKGKDNKETPKKEVKPIEKVEKTPLLKKEIQKQLDVLFDKYVKKIDAKTQDVNVRLQIVDDILEVLYGAKNTSKQHNLVVQYLIRKFEEYKELLYSDIGHIDSLIENIIGK